VSWLFSVNLQEQPQAHETIKSCVRTLERSKHFQITILLVRRSLPRPFHEKRGFVMQSTKFGDWLTYEFPWWPWTWILHQPNCSIRQNQLWKGFMLGGKNGTIRKSAQEKLKKRERNEKKSCAFEFCSTQCDILHLRTGEHLTRRCRDSSNYSWQPPRSCGRWLAPEVLGGIPRRHNINYLFRLPIRMLP